MSVLGEPMPVEVEQGRFAHIRHEVSERLTWRNVCRTIGGAALFAVPSAALGGALAYKLDSREATIASFNTEVRLATDGYVTLDAEPLTSIRLPVNKPFNLGAHIQLGKSEAPSEKVLYQEATALAAQPKGEIDKLSQATGSLVKGIGESAALGGAVGLGLFVMIGARRRQELAQKYGSKTTRVALVGVMATACAASTATAASDRPHEIQWQNIQNVLPDIPPDIAHLGIQVSSDVISNNATNIIRGMIKGYEQSEAEYKVMEKQAAALEGQLRQPKAGEVVIELIGDRHDNIGMDPVNAAIGKAAHADIVLDAGDDTSSGEDWEEFSAASLKANFKDFKNRAVVGGNHDNSDFAGRYLAKGKNTFTVLNHSGVMFDGIRILGFADIRSSSLVNSADFASVDLSGLKDQITKEACDANSAGKRASIILIHQASIAEGALKAGCTDLVLGGHLHRYVGPTAVMGANGDTGYSFTTDTAGGAALSMALGPLRRSAGVSLITMDVSGKTPIVVGTQKVVSTQYGEVLPQPFEYVSLETTGLPLPTQHKQGKSYPNLKAVGETRRQYK